MTPQFDRSNRRDFLKRSSAVTGALAMGYFSYPTLASESNSPNERLNIAAIGTMNRAGANIGALADQNIVALADIDANFLDQAGAKFPNARKYRDFRVMLEKEAGAIDAVVIGTADHTHAPAAAMALRLKKHVYCEKPLTHTVFEARTLTQLAKRNNLVTQMGTQIHAGDNYRRVVELIQAGAIGKVTEVHVWSGAKYSDAKFTTDTTSPAHVDWDLWLGPAPERPHSEGCHPFKWRGFWDYGSGALGDLACHHMDLSHWALNLRHPTNISAQGPAPDSVSTPAWCVVEYEYPARDEMPPVKLTWYDSGRRPELLATLKDKEGKPIKWGDGQIFVGSEGIILAGYGHHLLLPEDRFADYKRPDPTIPNSVGHHREWVQAIKTGGPTTCNFDYSGALTEAVLLGTVSYRSGKALEWDSESLQVTNAPEAQALIHKEYRKGWTI